MGDEPCIVGPPPHVQYCTNASLNRQPNPIRVDSYLDFEKILIHVIEFFINNHRQVIIGGPTFCT
jgi:hypothetical protein